ncbi:hypothetical protein ACIO1C_33250 [Streptomyces sp. NPDC087420]|uniref:hypothetical protein n=1 Tax=Streptomyces sp. NPDC087420 TaxID=3365785 RepID=UPI0038351C78
MPTATEYRHHYIRFAALVEEACTDPKARRVLRNGRSRPVDDCEGMHRFLSVPTRGYGHRRAHYTVASMIAHVDPLGALRAAAHHPDTTTDGHETTRERPGPTRPETTDKWTDPGESTVPGEPTGPGESTSPGELTDRGGGAPARERADPGDPGLWRRRPNLGETLAHAVRTAGFNETRTDELLAVMVRLGDNQLHRRLPALTGRLVDAGLIPDWPVLLDDLARRPYDQGRVATRWQDAFYRTLTPTPKETP